MCAVAETEGDRRGKLLTGKLASEIKNERLKSIAFNAVGYIFQDHNQHGTGFISSKKFFPE